jgi:hypothetical protein
MPQEQKERLVKEGVHLHENPQRLLGELAGAFLK